MNAASRPPSRFFRPMRVVALLGVTMLAYAGLGPAEAAAQALTLDLGDATGSTTARVVQLVALLTVLSLAPGILVMVTSFLRLVIVFHFVRTALGTQTTPPNIALVSLALFLTAFIMAPTFEAAWESGIRPLMNEQMDEAEAFSRTVVPFQEFMLRHVRDTDLNLFLNMAGVEVEAREDAPLQALVPAFMITELRRAFEIGFLIYVPFVIIDLVIASILMSMGMMMLPPIMIALPFKLIFFVLVDGWHVIVGSLVQSFGPFPGG